MSEINKIGVPAAKHRYQRIVSVAWRTRFLLQQFLCASYNQHNQLPFAAMRRRQSTTDVRSPPTPNATTKFASAPQWIQYLREGSNHETKIELHGSGSETDACDVRIGSTSRSKRFGDIANRLDKFSRVADQRLRVLSRHAFERFARRR